VHGRIRGRIGAVFALLAAAGRLTAGNPVDRFLYAIERLRRFCRLHPKIIFDGIIETEEAGVSLQGFGHEQSGLNTAGFGLLEKYANQHFEAVEIDQDGPSLHVVVERTKRPIKPLGDLDGTELQFSTEHTRAAAVKRLLEDVIVLI